MTEQTIINIPISEIRIVNSRSRSKVKWQSIVQSIKNQGGMGSFYRSQHELVLVFRKGMNNAFSLSINEFHTILRNDLTSFIERSFYELNPQANFQPSPYIELLAAKLEKCRIGETKRLIINLPPRTLKSHAATVAFTAWLLGHQPTSQIICASYGQDLADKHARDCRTLIGSDFYRRLFTHTVLSEAKQSVNDFMTTQQGFRMATSVGGVLTGRGADVIILDDILKPEDALSETRRHAANDWYFNTVLSRLNSKEHGVIIIVMQRLHQEDLVGEVTAREPWEVLSLPAIATDDECYPYRSLFGESSFIRKKGDALHPERDSVETYRKIRESIGEYTRHVIQTDCVRPVAPSRFSRA